MPETLVFAWIKSITSCFFSVDHTPPIKIKFKTKEKIESVYWIPRSILSDRHFRTLEEYVNLNKLRPFYNLASDAVHAGSKGFYRLGLRSDEQDKIFLVGASNYGLADPLQNTAISLSHVSGCLLLLNPDFENLIQSQVILNYVKEIGISAVDVHKSFENEERAK